MDFGVITYVSEKYFRLKFISMGCLSLKNDFCSFWMQWLVTSCSFIICLNLVKYRLSHKVLIFLIVTSVIYFVSRHRCCCRASVVYFLSATNFLDKAMALQWEYNNFRDALLCHTSVPSSLVFMPSKCLSFIYFKAFLCWRYRVLHSPHIEELGKQQFCIQFTHYPHNFVNLCYIFPCPSQ